MLVIPDHQIELLLEQRGVIDQPEHFLERMVQLIEIALNEPETSLAHYRLQLAEEHDLIQKTNQTQYYVARARYSNYSENKLELRLNKRRYLMKIISSVSVKCVCKFVR